MQIEESCRPKALRSLGDCSGADEALKGCGCGGRAEAGAIGSVVPTQMACSCSPKQESSGQSGAGRRVREALARRIAIACVYFLCNDVAGGHESIAEVLDCRLYPTVVSLHCRSIAANSIACGEGDAQKLCGWFNCWRDMKAIAVKVKASYSRVREEEFLVLRRRFVSV